MNRYTYRRTTGCDTLATPAWHGLPLGWIIIDPGGKRADWPMLDTEAEAIADVREFNRPDDDDGRNEAMWQARMAGDMDA